MRRVVLFLILLGLGVGLLYLIAERDNWSHQDQPIEAPEKIQMSPGSHTSAEGLNITTYRASVDREGVAVRIPYHHLQSASFEDAGGGVYKLKKVLFKVFREDKPDSVSLALQAARGTVYLDGRLENFRLREDQPIYLEEATADLYDPHADVPPLRIQSEHIVGYLKDKRITTDDPVRIQQIESSDFLATGIGLDAEAVQGTAILKKDAALEYLSRNEKSGPPVRRLKLSCEGPLTLERVPDEAGAPSQGRRLATAEGKAVLDIEDLSDHSRQTIRSKKMIARLRGEKNKDKAVAQANSKKTAPVALEKMEALGDVQIDAGDAQIFGDTAQTEIGEEGRIQATKIEGHPRAIFSSKNAGALANNTEAPGKKVRVECDGPIYFSQGKTGSQFVVSFEENVKLFGTAPDENLPSRFGSNLALTLEKTASAESSSSAWKLIEGHASGNVFWTDGQSSVESPDMEIRESSSERGATEVSFFPNPLLKTKLGGPLLAVEKEKSPATRELVARAAERITQRTDPSGKTKGSIFLRGKVEGTVQIPDSSPGRIEANGLTLVPQANGSTRIWAENGLLYDEGKAGLFVEAQKILPGTEGWMKLQGMPAKVRQPDANGKMTEISAQEIQLNPDTGAFTAKNSVSLLIPEANVSLAGDSVPGKKSNSSAPVTMLCEFLEGKRGTGANGLDYLKAQVRVQINSKEQQARAESVHFDFTNDVHRLFGSPEKPASISGPTEKGHFLVESVKIEILEKGARMVLAPNALIEVDGEGADLGELSKGSSKKDQKIIVRPQGESELNKARMILKGGVSLEPKGLKPEDSWSMKSKELIFHRDEKTGELKSLEAIGAVRFASSEVLGQGKRLEFFPDSSDLILYGDSEQNASLEIFGKTRMENEVIQYNLKTHLLKGGRGKTNPLK